MFLWRTLKPATLLAVLRSTRAPAGGGAPSLKGGAAAQRADAAPAGKRPPRRAGPASVAPRFGGSGTR